MKIEVKFKFNIYCIYISQYRRCWEEREDCGIFSELFSSLEWRRMWSFQAALCWPLAAAGLLPLRSWKSPSSETPLRSITDNYIIEGSLHNGQVHCELDSVGFNVINIQGRLSENFRRMSCPAWGFLTLC